MESPELRTNDPLGTSVAKTLYHNRIYVNFFRTPKMFAGPHSCDFNYLLDHTILFTASKAIYHTLSDIKEERSH